MADHVVITKKRRENLVKASAGAIILPPIIGMAFGDGGCDNSGNITNPSDDQEGLAHELYRKPIDGYRFTQDTTCRYECTMTESELVDAYISEIGLYDSQGNIVCIKNFKRKGKDDDLEMTYVLDDIF